MLADTFILSFDERAGHPFRIAGTRICAAFGRELKNEAFLDLWARGSRGGRCAISSTSSPSETVGAVASARGTLDGEDSTHELELLVLPLSHRGRTDARVLGRLGAARRGALAWRLHARQR